MSLLELLARARKQEKRSSLGPALLGTGIGMAIGLCAGLLFAPRTGKETRERLAIDAKAAAVILKESLTEAKEKIEEVAGNIRERYNAEDTRSEGPEIEADAAAKGKKQAKNQPAA
jgi:gas vesicle protein